MSGWHAREATTPSAPRRTRPHHRLPHLALARDRPPAHPSRDHQARHSNRPSRHRPYRSAKPPMTPYRRRLRTIHEHPRLPAAHPRSRTSHASAAGQPRQPLTRHRLIKRSISIDAGGDRCISDEVRLSGSQPQSAPFPGGATGPASACRWPDGRSQHAGSLLLPRETRRGVRGLCPGCSGRERRAVRHGAPCRESESRAGRRRHDRRRASRVLAGHRHAGSQQATIAAERRCRIRSRCTHVKRVGNLFRSGRFPQLIVEPDHDRAAPTARAAAGDDRAGSRRHCAPSRTRWSRCSLSLGTNLRSGRDGDEQTSGRPRLRQRPRQAACPPPAGQLTPGRGRSGRPPCLLAASILGDLQTIGRLVIVLHSRESISRGAGEDLLCKGRPAGAKASRPLTPANGGCGSSA